MRLKKVLEQKRQYLQKCSNHFQYRNILLFLKQLMQIAPELKSQW